MPQQYLETDALLSDDGMYRYWLNRHLSMGDQSVAFVGLNPSTADATKDDPTIRKCAGFARRWGFDWLFMVNLYAWRSTDPKLLVKFAKAQGTNAIGPENLTHLLRVCLRCDLVIAAWGAAPLTSGAEAIGEQVLALPQTKVLRFTSKGRPEHPLYMPYDVELLPARGGRPND
jgi:hypothetical protein